jgi:hypothetical protein
MASLRLSVTTPKDLVPAHHQPHRRLLLLKHQYLQHFVDEFVVDLAVFDLYFFS